jgi:hypothetical protein
MTWLRPLALENIIPPADPVLGGTLSLVDLLGFVSASVCIEHDPVELGMLVKVRCNVLLNTVSKDNLATSVGMIWSGPRTVAIQPYSVHLLFDLVAHGYRLRHLRCAAHQGRIV